MLFLSLTLPLTPPIAPTCPSLYYSLCLYVVDARVFVVMKVQSMDKLGADVTEVRTKQNSESDVV